MPVLLFNFAEVSTCKKALVEPRICVDGDDTDVKEMRFMLEHSPILQAGLCPDLPQGKNGLTRFEDEQHMHVKFKVRPCNTSINEDRSQVVSTGVLQKRDS
ncbi:hypothetical protein KIW84_041718 [Lathyrus oleraceus]|uniref:Uncharacterized protein n=1 Tax=Pisum sativum TaxID=3888 RepID=A0A9D4XDF8_PEA|nr:hypothetical protein KIW84_041718 [Pisum sativum]